MKNNKLAYNITITVSMLFAFVSYFFAFFKYKGILDGLGSMLGLGDAVSEKMTMLNITGMIFDSIDAEGGVLALIGLIFAFFIPALMAIVASFIVYVVKPKVGGIIATLAAASGVIGDIILVVVLNWKFDLGLGMGASLSSFITFDIPYYINAVCFITALVVGIMLITASKKDTSFIGYNGNVANNYGSYQQNYNNDYNYNQENQGYGYDQGYGNNYHGYNNNSGYQGYDSNQNTAINDDNGVTVKLAGTVVCNKGGRYTGAAFPISNNENITIGRDPRQCNIVLGEENIYVGRKHCTINYSSIDKNYRVSVFSSNGILLNNGKRIKTGETIILPSGTVIYLGNKENEFLLS